MKAPSRFYASLSLLVVLNAIIKPVWLLGIDRQVQVEVGMPEFGSYFSILNLSIVFSFLLDWGITAFINRQLAFHQQDLMAKTGYFLSLKILLAILYAAIVAITAYFTGIKDWTLLFGILSLQVLTSLLIFFRAIMTSQQWFSTDAWLSVFDKLLMIFTVGSLLLLPGWFGSISIMKFVWLQAACIGLATLISFIILNARGIPFRVLTLFPGRQLLKSAMPYALVVLLMSIHYRADGFLLERIHHDGAHQAGIYVAAYRLLDGANMVGVLLSSFLLPYVARQFSEKKEFQSVVLTVRHFIVLFALGVSCIAVFLAPWIQQLLYRQADPEIIEVLQWCLPALLGYSLVHLYGTVMTAAGHLRAFCWIILASVILNISLNLLLIPDLGAKGCCIAALSSQSLCGMLTAVYVKQRLHISAGLRSLVVYVLTAFVLGSLFYWGSNLIKEQWILIITGILVVFAIMYASKLIRPSAVTSLLRKPQL